MRTLLRAALLTVWVCCCPLAIPVADAQTGASVSGVVTDSQGAVLPGAVVAATAAGNQQPVEATTDRDGRYTLTGLPPGPAIIRVTMAGFETTTSQNFVEEDFSAEERVVAGYGMVSLNFGKATVAAGVRVERTHADYFANELLFDDGTFTGTARPVSGNTDYTHVLPAVHLTFKPADRLTVRLAWTNTIGRPAYADLAPLSELDEVQESDGSYIGSLSTGNPELKPYESINLDASIEYYLPSGLVAIAPFYKHIDNPIFGYSETLQDAVHNDRLYETSGISRPENADSGTIAGVEFTFQTQFTGLPVPFDGLGTNVNYTWTDSSVTLFTRSDERPFFQQSDHIGNAALLYNKHGVEAQLSLSFQSPALGSVGANADRDNYSDWYRPLDAKISVPVARGLRAFVELRHMNDEPRVRYFGVPERLAAHEIYGRDYYAGIDWRF
jgi:TonB-dependent receptor